MTRLLHLTWAERLLLAEAVLFLGLARLALLVLPFRMIAARLGRPWVESPTTATPEETATAARIGRFVGSGARNVVWRSQCLVQALAADVMLRRRGIPTTLYLGVARDESRSLEAHAWLRVGQLVVTGAGDKDRYTVVSTFGVEGS